MHPPTDTQLGKIISPAIDKDTLKTQVERQMVIDRPTQRLLRTKKFKAASRRQAAKINVAEIGKTRRQTRVRDKREVGIVINLALVGINIGVDSEARQPLRVNRGWREQRQR